MDRSDHLLRKLLGREIRTNWSAMASVTSVAYTIAALQERGSVA